MGTCTSKSSCIKVSGGGIYTIHGDTYDLGRSTSSCYNLFGSIPILDVHLNYNTSEDYTVSAGGLKIMYIGADKKITSQCSGVTFGHTFWSYDPYFTLNDSTITDTNGNSLKSGIDYWKGDSYYLNLNQGPPDCKHHGAYIKFTREPIKSGSNRIAITNPMFNPQVTDSRYNSLIIISMLVTLAVLIFCLSKKK